MDILWLNYSDRGARSLDKKTESQNQITIVGESSDIQTTTSLQTLPHFSITKKRQQPHAEMEVLNAYL